MSEAEASADVHQAVHDELEENVISSIKTWQKTKYVKSMMHVKCTKEFDEDFKRVRSTFVFILEILFESKLCSITF